MDILAQQSLQGAGEHSNGNVAGPQHVLQKLGNTEEDTPSKDVKLLFYQLLGDGMADA